MSRTQTISVPSISAIAAVGSQGVGPAILARSSTTPQRALIRNVGPNVVLIAFEAAAVSDLTSILESFRLDPGVDEVFVLEKGDQLYAVALGATGQISAHVSPAFPLGIWAES